MQNARRAHKIRLCGHLRRYKKIVKKTYIISNKWYIILLVPVLGFLGHVTYMVILEKRPNWIGRNGIKKYSFLYFPMLTCFAIIFMLWNS